MLSTARSLHRTPDPATRRSSSPPSYQDLRRRFRRFVFPMTALFLAWYFLYVLLAAVRPRLHVDQGVRQHQRRPALRAAAVRLDVRHHHDLRALGRPALRPRRRGASRARSKGATSERRHPRGAARRHQRRQPRRQHRDLRAVRHRHPGHRDPGLPQQPDRGRLLRRRPRVHRPPERHRHRRRLPVGGVLPRHRRGHRHQRLRRLPLLDRLPRRLARRPAAGRRAAPEHRPVHHGRRPVLPAAGSGRSGWPRRSRPSVVSFFYLLAQMAGAGGLVALLLGIDGPVGQSLVIAVVGVDHDHLRAGRRHEGHHLGADHQGRPARHRRGRHDALGARASTASTSPPCSALRSTARPKGEAILGPGLQYGATTTSKLDFISLGAGPGARHRRPPARADALLHGAVVARRPGSRSSWAIWIIGIFYLFTLVLGYGAAALVGPDTISAAPGGANSAAPLLAFELGGRSCSASSPPSRSPRSSRSWPD